METVKLMSYTEYCIDHIKTELPEWLDTNVYACDLSSALTEAININGTATYSTDLAKQYIQYWWDEAADYMEYEKVHFGQNLHNPFERPEAFHVCMIIQGVSSLLSQCNIIGENWNAQIHLTQEVIDTVLKEIDGLEVEF